MDEKSSHDASSEATRIFQARLAEAWKNTLGGLAPAAEQISTQVGRLAHRLEVSQDEALKIFGEFTKRMRQDREEMERRIEQGVRQTMSGLGLAATQEIKDLELRVEAISKRLDKIGAAGGRA